MRHQFMRVGGGVRLWTPAEISTALWLDAADSSTLQLSSGAVAQWNDKSGNGRHVSQLTPDFRPVLTTNGLGGKNIVTFDGLNDILTGVMSGVLTGTFAFFAVVVPPLAANNAWVVSEAVNYSNYWAFLGTNPSSARAFAVFDGGSQNPVATAASSQPTGNAELAFGVRQVSGPGRYELLYYFNDALWSGGITDFINTAPQHSTISIGGQSTFTNRFLAGSIAEVLILTQAPSTVFSTSVRQLVAGYAAHKWGLANLLPAGHPYKSSPPTI